MGRYTDLARKHPEEPQGGETFVLNNNVNINNIYNNRDVSIDKPTTARPKDTLKGSPSVEKAQSRASGDKDGPGGLKERITNLRTTNLTNLPEEEVWIATKPEPRYTNLAREEAPPVAAVRCIHDMTPDTCAVCSGYARWLIEDERRLRRAQADSEGVRREFWRSVRGAS